MINPLKRILFSYLKGQVISKFTEKYLYSFHGKEEKFAEK